ncbi:hypothetical protein PFISCL1PPCAC_1312, partial [Pristionchus fissidentatus]
MESKLVKVVTKIFSFFFVLRFCVAFSFIAEIFSKVFKLEHELLFHGGSDPKKYLIAFTAASLLILLGDLSLGLCHLILKARSRKRLLIYIIAFHFVILLPTGGSGVYLALKERFVKPTFSWQGHYSNLSVHLPVCHLWST